MAPVLTFLCELDPRPLGELLDDRVLGLLARRGARVSMAMRDLSHERAQVVRRIREAGIEVGAWLVLPHEDGYWCHARNVPAVQRRLLELEAWCRRFSLDFRAIAFDVEPDIRDEAVMPTAGLRLVPRLARTVVSPQALAEAEAAYASLAEDQRRRGREVLAYGVPFLADELARGSTRLRRTLGTVAIPGAVHVPMLYSSFARPLGKALVARYARTSRTVAIGSTGGGVSAGGLDRVRPLSWDELSRDLALAERHCDEVHVFSLEGCVREGFLERLA